MWLHGLAVHGTLVSYNSVIEVLVKQYPLYMCVCVLFLY